MDLWRCVGVCMIESNLVTHPDPRYFEPGLTLDPQKMRHNWVSFFDLV